MAKKRKNYSPDQKAQILKKHLWKWGHPLKVNSRKKAYNDIFSITEAECYFGLQAIREKGSGRGGEGVTS